MYFLALYLDFYNCKMFNSPINRFSQSLYESQISEGQPKNSIVTRIEAFDLDDANSRLAFEIVDGNVDGAFTMKSSTPGLNFLILPMYFSS